MDLDRWDFTFVTSGAARTGSLPICGARNLHEQLAALDSETAPGASREELIAEMAANFERAQAAICAIHPAALAEPREVGRRKLPTTVIGLIIHIAEHTQRHVGQTISAAKLIRSMK